MKTPELNRKVKYKLKTELFDRKGKFIYFEREIIIIENLTIFNTRRTRKVSHVSDVEKWGYI